MKAIVFMTDSVFLEKMGDSPQTKILDFLLTFREFDYSPTDIAKESEVSWITAKKIIANLCATKRKIQENTPHPNIYILISEHLFI